MNIIENEKVAIIGSSGSGKSTLVKLLTRFFEANSGEITIGGINLKDMNLSQVREIVHYLPQNPSFFTGTILDNLKMGGDDASDEKIREVCELVEIWEDIEKMELGLHPQISGESVALSCGQKKRLALARTLPTSANILILDEATSSLDVVTEKKIISRLLNLNRTIIFIAHRLTIAEKADRIFVVDSGKIVEAGEPHTLKELQGKFSELIESNQ